MVLEVGILDSKPDGGRVEVDCVLYRAVVEGMSVEEVALVTVLLM